MDSDQGRYMDGDQITKQREYYAATALSYDAMHENEYEGTKIAIGALVSTLDLVGAVSLLDVGCGTGSLLAEILNRRPATQVVGLEPVEALRDIARSKGLSAAQVVSGDAMSMHFATASIDVVCAFSVLHHVPDPAKVIGEMLRVAKKAVVICDANNFGQGTVFARTAKQALNAMRLWRLANWIKTGGRGFTFTEGDGVAYSYSVFSNLDQLRTASRELHLIGLGATSPNLYANCGNIAVIAIR
jgi:ubiquinone/menaquinone biosynthesis C-methylase UbiE